MGVTPADQGFAVGSFSAFHEVRASGQEQRDPVPLGTSYGTGPDGLLTRITGGLFRKRRAAPHTAILASAIRGKG